MKGLIERHPAVTFVAVTYLISWSIWIPTVRAFLAPAVPVVIVPLLLLALVGSYGPTIAAFLLTGLARGRPGIRELASRYLRWRVGGRWYLLAALVPVLVFLAAVGTRVAQGAPIGAPAWSRLTLGAFLARLTFALPFGPLAEEAGWRGYLLPTLTRRRSALSASLLIGVAWTFWHLPMFWVPGAALPPSVVPGIGAIGTYWLGVTATSIIATALYQSAGGSLLIAILYHLATNLWHQVLAPVFLGDALAAWADLRWPSLAANWAVALTFVAVLGWRTLGAGPARATERVPAS